MDMGDVKYRGEGLIHMGFGRNFIQKLGIGLIFLLVLGCEKGENTLFPQENRTGITRDEIRIGSSLALGGHAGYLGSQMLHGAKAYINHINESGGIHGRKINLVFT